MASKTFEIVRPKSLQDSAYEEFEYLIRWIGRDGADYQYLFYDAEFRRRTRNNIVNRESSTKIQSLISREEREITLMADDLSYNDLQVLLQMLSNNFVTRIFKDETTERFAPDESSTKYRLMDRRYELEFTLIRTDLAAWN